MRRVGLLDRAALHLGVALVKWGRRPVKPELRERLVDHAELVEARLKREELQNQHHLWGADLTRMR